MSEKLKRGEWKVGKKETLLQTRVGNITSAPVTNARTGSKANFYCLEFADWVNVIAITSGQEVVMIRQYRFGTERLELEIPGGAIEAGEDPLKAGLRELLEETGYVGQNGRIIGEVRPNPAIQSNRCYTVLVEDVQRVAEQNMDEMEDIEVMTMPLGEVEGLISRGGISHGLVLNALLFYQRLR